MNSKPHLFDAEVEQLGSAILTEFQDTEIYPRDRVTHLVRLALSDDAQVAEQASRAFFTTLVEALADSFEPAAVSLYNQAAAQLIQACRITERGRPLDEKLSEFGLRTEADVLARSSRLRAFAPHPLPDLGGNDVNAHAQPQRVIVLSRVTLGADVAITSVMIERFKTGFPDAEIVLVGDRKTSELFGGDSRVSIELLSYPRAATAAEKLLAWVPLVECVRELTNAVERSLVVDPDSRLTQLGLLPLTSEGVGDPHPAGASDPRYLFFPSREYQHESSASLAELTSSWADRALSAAQPASPTVSLARADLEAARSLIERVKRAGQPVITINLGVGGNPRKRVGDYFERQLVASLLGDGATIVLDKGAGADEERRAEGVIEFAKRASNDRLLLIELDEQSLTGVGVGDRIEAELVVWSGRIGLLAALIGESDLYIGYDSAGQHIAAALGVPCIDVFAGFGSRRMLERWRPTGRAETRVVIAEPSMSEEEVLAKTLRHAREIKSRPRTP